MRGAGVGGSRWYRVWGAAARWGGLGVGRGKSESESEEQGEKKERSSSEGVERFREGGGDRLRRWGWRGEDDGVGRGRG